MFEAVLLAVLVVGAFDLGDDCDVQLVLGCLSVLVEDRSCGRRLKNNLHGGVVPTGGNHAHGGGQTVAGEGPLGPPWTGTGFPVRVHNAVSNIAAHTDGISERVNSELCLSTASRAFILFRTSQHLKRKPAALLYQV